MNKKILTSIALIIFGTGLYLWWFSDSKIVTRSTESLIECFQKESGDGRLGGAITTSTFRDLLDDNITLTINRADIPYVSELGTTLIKEELVQMHRGLVNSPAIVTITNKQINIDNITHDTATVTLNFHIKSPQAKLDHNIKSTLTYQKINSDWKISKATLAE